MIIDISIDAITHSNPSIKERIPKASSRLGNLLNIILNRKKLTPPNNIVYILTIKDIILPVPLLVFMLCLPPPNFLHVLL